MNINYFAQLANKANEEQAEIAKKELYEACLERARKGYYSIFVDFKQELMIPLADFFRENSLKPFYLGSYVRNGERMNSFQVVWIEDERKVVGFNGQQ
jgi:hypothetical protein